MGVSLDEYVLRLFSEHRTGWGAVLACGTVIVGLCLVYLGVHWASDVLAGWALGTAVGVGAGLLFRSGPWVAQSTRAAGNP